MVVVAATIITRGREPWPRRSRRSVYLTVTVALGVGALSATPVPLASFGRDCRNGYERTYVPAAAAPWVLATSTRETTELIYARDFGGCAYPA